MKSRVGRKTLSIVRLVALAMAGLTLITAACSNDTPASQPASAAITADTAVSAEAKLEIVTTLYPLEYFSKRIAGETVTVANLVAPGVEPHDFEPTPGDMRTLSGADIFIYNGAGLEPWIDRALESVPDSVTVVEAAHDLADGYEEEGEHEEGHGHNAIDPHVWLDPLKAIEQVKIIRDALVGRNPGQAVMYGANADSLITELDNLHARFLAGLSSCAEDHAVTSHEAFGYMGRRYGIEQTGISGISPEAEPTPQDLAAISDQVKGLGIRYILVEPIVSRRLAETVARETGAALLPLHPLESVTLDESQAGETYFTLMGKNLESLRLALGCL